jgi:hypothetical protein
MASLHQFLKTITTFNDEVKESLIIEYNDVYNRLKEIRPKLMESLKPGPELRRSYGNVYSDGNFSVYWLEKKLLLNNLE